MTRILSLIGVVLVVGCGSPPPDGPYEGYYDNGQLESRGNYIDGGREGLRETFHRNGQLGIRGNYKNGWQNGLWEFFEEDGTLDSAQTFRNGKRIETNRNP